MMTALPMNKQHSSSSSRICTNAEYGCDTAVHWIIRMQMLILGNRSISKCINLSHLSINFLDSHTFRMSSLMFFSFFRFFLFNYITQGFSKSDHHHRSDSAPAVELKPLPKGIICKTLFWLLLLSTLFMPNEIV